MLWANYYGSEWKCWYKTANRARWWKQHCSTGQGEVHQWTPAVCLASRHEELHRENTNCTDKEQFLSQPITRPYVLFHLLLLLMDRLLGLSVFLMGLTDVHNLFSCTFKLHLEDKISDLSIVANWAAWFSDDVPWKCVQIFTGPGGLILMHLMIP